VGSRNFLGRIVSRGPRIRPRGPQYIQPRAPTRRKEQRRRAAPGASGAHGKALGSASWPAPQIPYACTWDEYVANRANTSSVPSNGGLSHAQAMRSIELFATEVMPRYASAPVALSPGEVRGTHDVLALKNVFSKKAETVTLGRSTTLLMRKSTATLQMILGLFPAPTSLLQQLDHVDQGVAGRRVRSSPSVCRPHGWACPSSQ